MLRCWIQVVSLVWMSGSLNNVAQAEEYYTTIPDFRDRVVELFQGIGGDPVSELWRVDVSSVDFYGNTVLACNVFRPSRCMLFEMRVSNPSHAYVDGDRVCIDDPNPYVDVFWSFVFPETANARSILWTEIEAFSWTDLWTVIHSYATGIGAIDMYRVPWTPLDVGVVYPFSDEVITNPIIKSHTKLCIGDVYVVR